MNIKLKNKNNNTYRILIFVIAFIFVCTMLIFFVIKPFSTESAIIQSKFGIEYNVSFENSNIQILDVDMRLNIKKLSDEKIIYLYRGNVDVPISACVGDNKNAIAYRDTGEIIAVGPIEDDTAYVDISYGVRIGKQNDNGYDSITYTKGILNDELLVFTGENVLLTPFMDPSDINATEKYIDNVSFRLKTDKDWQAIIPYAEKTMDKTLSFSIDMPTWAVFNGISKSAFCFGGFDEFAVGDKEKPDALFYIDKGASDNINELSLKALKELVDFYKIVFGEGLGDKPFVILRNNNEDNSIILGGVGSQTSAMSINLRLADDCEVLSRTVFHAFFDSKIKAPNIRYAPNEWVYKGLADYYVSASANALSDDVKKELSIYNRDTMEKKYLRYLYFSLKEPGFLVVNPLDEGKMYTAQNEYYVSTKVPLIIDYINYSAWKQSGISDGFIKELVAKCGEEKNIEISNIISDICKKDKEAIEKYFSGSALIPNYNDFHIDGYIPNDEVVYEIDSYEHMFSDMFTNEYIKYPYEPTYLLDKNNFEKAVEENPVSYGTSEVESTVKSFSSAVDQLLKQYAMRGKLAGIDDITKPDAKESLYKKESIKKWTEFSNRIGYAKDR